MKNFLLGLVLLAPGMLFAQSITGVLQNTDNEPWLYASVLVAETKVGTTTDEAGNFTLAALPGQSLIVSHLSFGTDTLRVPDVIPSPWIITIEGGVALETVEIKDKSGGTRVNFLDPKNVEVLGEEELTKAACCNLSESFETNASVDVSSGDAATGLKEVYLLGLNGTNILFSQDNIPDQLGIDRPFGMMSIPGPWLETVAVSKGTGSVVNAGQGIAGQIDYQEKSFADDKGYINGYANAFGRYEMNAGVGQFNENGFRQHIQGHFSRRRGVLDQNKDGFYDMPEMESISGTYFVQKDTDKGCKSLFARWGQHQLAGGSLEDENQKTSWKHSRFKLGGKWGFKGHDPDKSLGIQWFVKHSQSVGQMFHNGGDFTENRVYLNVIRQTYFGCSKKVLKYGVNLTAFQQDLSLTSSLQNQTSDHSTSPDGVISGSGIFSEFVYSPTHKFKLISGIRFQPFVHMQDRQFRISDGVLPRLHLRYLLTDNWTVKGVVGKTARLQNAFTDGLRYFASTQTIDPGFNDRQSSVWPEIGTNAGVSTVYKHIGAGNMESTFSAEYYFTQFSSYSVAQINDLNGVEFINVHEHSAFGFGSNKRVQNFLVQAKTNLNSSWDVRLGYRWVKSEQPTKNSGLNQAWFLPTHRGFVNLAYQYETGPESRWRFDVTTHIVGRQFLPTMWYAEAQTPTYVLFNTQVNYEHKKLTVYLGSENIGNYRVYNPVVNEGGIIDVGRGFLNQPMLAYGAWGPVAGRNIYLGLTVRF